MCKRVSVFLALAFAFFGTQCWGADNCSSVEGGVSCSFTPGTTKGIYDFRSTGDGLLTVDFVTVLTTFTLTVSVSHPSNPLPLDPHVFPEGTVCVKYSANGGNCDEYDFSGSSTGPNGVPVKNKDYKGLITLTLSYFTNQTVHSPAFLHAPGDNPSAVYSEDILTSYSTPCTLCDPTMGGKLPNLSAVAAFDKPGDNDCFVFMSPTPGQTFQVGQEIEVEFQLTSPTCGGSPIRDKDARLSLSTTDTMGNTVFVPLRNKEEGNKFHFDKDEGVNELDLSTEGLAAPRSYTITVFSDEFSPQSVDINLIP